jgi:hypothetical protein
VSNAHHASLGSSLLCLEKDCFLFTAFRARLVDSWQLSTAVSLSYLPWCAIKDCQIQIKQAYPSLLSSARCLRFVLLFNVFDRYWLLRGPWELGLERFDGLGSYGRLLLEEVLLTGGAAGNAQRRRFQTSVEGVRHFLIFYLEPKTTIRLLPADLAEDLIPTEGAKVRSRVEGTCRWIICNILGHSTRLADRVGAQVVSVDAFG